MKENRRDFIKKAALTAGAINMAGMTGQITQSLMPMENEQIVRVSGLKKPVAIAMWDFSWILRHHLYGEFENWDKVLEGLAERGYNAIRMDAMPQYVAADTSGRVEQEFRSVKNGWKPSLWGNDYTMSFRPREALLEFIPMCKKYGIRIGLATWFMNHGTERRDIFLEEGGLLRAWEETLAFLDSHNLLNNIIYVDLLNEYPKWHGYDWLSNRLKELSGDDRKKFYNQFINKLIVSLKAKYPDLDFYASLDSGMDLDKIDLTHFNALDYHIWFAHSDKVPGLNEINAIDQTLDYRKVYAGLLEYWAGNKNALVDWMDGRLTDISSAASQNGIVCGNTEGWGPISWFDHPELDWNWVKESGEICVDLARKHENYKFLCTSNFTHPQFRGMWEDVNWHKKITSRIKA